MYTSVQFDRVPYHQLSNEEKIQLQWMYKIGVPLEFSSPYDKIWRRLTPPVFQSERFEAICINVYVRPCLTDDSKT